MADVRINALPTTATSAASDDYLALDGSANGTRKILATNVAQNVTDVTFGTSGPSAKSSIAARAARQGLVFDGTAGVSNSVTIAPAGTYTVSLVATPSDSTDRALISTRLAGGGGTAGFVLARVGATEVLNFYSFSGTPSLVSTTGTLPLGKSTKVDLVLNQGNVSIYLNGVLSVSQTVSGLSSTAYSLEIGADSVGGGSSKWLGGLNVVGIYNRALSAAEVVSLYESGVPSGADYNNASNTSIITGANSDFSSDTGYWTKVGTATISGGVATIPNNTSNITRNGLFTVGKRYRIQLTISSVSGGGLYVYDGAIQATYTTNGTKTLEWTATGANLIIGASGSGNVDDVLIYPLGLLLAPDAAQAGGGLTWYDTSGNAANITLPASGVTWNVPSSLKTASGWTYASSTETALTLTSGSTVSSNRVLRLLTTGTNVTNSGLSLESSSSDTASRNWAIATNNAAYGDLIILQSNAAGGNALTAGSNAFYLSPSRNLLLGTTTDSANGKLQLASHTTSAGGIGFGTDSWLYRESAGLLNLGSNGNAVLKVDGAVGSVQGIIFSKAGTEKARVAVEGSGSNLILYTGAAINALQLSGSDQSATFAGTVTSSKAGAAFVVSGNSSWIQGPSGGALALLGTSGNDVVIKPNGGALAATFSSTVATLSVPLRLGNAYTAGAVVTTGYVTIQDSSGTTYKIPVGT